MSYPNWPRMEGPFEPGDPVPDFRSHIDDPCPACGGAGEVEVPIARDNFGNWDTEWFPCSDCERSW